MRCIVSSGFYRYPSPVIDANGRLFAPYLAKIALDTSIYRRSKVASNIRPIDNLPLFREGVHTQIKRAYELSVCLKGCAFTA